MRSSTAPASSPASATSRPSIAAAAERSRIAGEMHDIVSHSLTVMITLADGSARLAATAPARSAETMELVAETGRGALADMRRLLGVLRDGDGDADAAAPSPASPSWATLVETLPGRRAAGAHHRVGDAARGRGPAAHDLPRRAGGSHQRPPLRGDGHAVGVVLVFQPGTVIITIDDDATVHGAPGQGSGRGLIGLRERVGLYGGTLEAGPRSGGGWRVRGRLRRPARRTGIRLTRRSIHRRRPTAEPTERTP